MRGGQQREAAAERARRATTGNGWQQRETADNQGAIKGNDGNGGKTLQMPRTLEVAGKRGIIPTC